MVLHFDSRFELNNSSRISLILSVFDRCLGHKNWILGKFSKLSGFPSPVRVFLTGMSHFIQIHTVTLTVQRVTAQKGLLYMV